MGECGGLKKIYQDYDVRLSQQIFILSKTIRFSHELVLGLLF